MRLRRTIGLTAALAAAGVLALVVLRDLLAHLALEALLAWQGFEDARIEDVALDAERLEIRGLALEAMPGSGEVVLDLSLRGWIRSMTGVLSLKSAQIVAANGVVIEGAGLQLPITVVPSFEGLTVRLIEPGDFSASGIEAAGVRAGPLDATIEAKDDAPLAAIRFRDPRPWSADAVIEPRPLTLHVPAGGAPLQVALRLGTITIEATGEGPATWRAQARLQDAGAGYPASGIRADGMSAAATLTSDGLDGPLTYGIARVSSSARPPLFAPLRLQGSLVQESEAEVAYQGEVTAAAGATLTYSGAADLGAGTARAFLDLEPVRFAPGGLQPVDLAPLLRDKIEQVKGSVELRGEIALDQAGLRPDLSILLDDLAFTAGPGRFDGLSGVLAVDQLIPPVVRTAPALRLQRAEIGLPLSRGRLAFELRADGAIEIEQVRFALARGEVEVRPFRLQPSGPVFQTELVAERLALADLFDAIEVDGLSGHGTLHGTLPLRSQEGHVVVDHGVLESTGRGVIRYRPEQDPGALASGGAGAGLLLQALDNFRYDELRITLNGRTDAEMDVDLHLEGANPRLYDGYPIEFNLSLEGPLAALVQGGVASWTLPERIRRQIERGTSP